MVKQPAVYIMADQENGALYTGVTSDLIQLVYQHRSGLLPGFTDKHGCKLLVWFEQHETMESSIVREKQIKVGSRAKKTAIDQSHERELE